MNGYRSTLGVDSLAFSTTFFFRAILAFVLSLSLLLLVNFFLHHCISRAFSFNRCTLSVCANALVCPRRTTLRFRWIAVCFVLFCFIAIMKPHIILEDDDFFSSLLFLQHFLSSAVDSLRFDFLKIYFIHTHTTLLAHFLDRFRL